MGNDGKLVAENLFATTSAIVGRTIALTRWSVSPTLMEIMMKDVKKLDQHGKNLFFRFARDGVQRVHARRARLWSRFHRCHWDDDLLQEVQVSHFKFKNNLFLD